MSGSQKEEMILQALLTNKSVEVASQAIGIPKRTIYDYLKRDDFRQRYNEAKEDLLRSVTNNLQSKMFNAVEVISSLMEDDEVSSQVRLNAAKTLLENASKFSEIEQLLDRINRLEEINQI